MEALIIAAITAIVTSSGAQKAGKELSNAVWTDFLRPLFLKDDPEDGQQTVDKIEAAPAEEPNKQLMRAKLKEHLMRSPDAISRLQKLLPETTPGSQIIDNARASIDKQINIQKAGDLHF